MPRWIRDEQGIAFEASFGRTKDQALAMYKEAAKARWPDPKRPDALPYQGHDRRILRAPPENDTQYTARLLTAHDLWLWGGTPTGIANLFAPYNYTVTGAIEQTTPWEPFTVYNNGDQRLAFGNVYEMCGAPSSVSGDVPPSGQGGANGGATPQADSIVDGSCLWNFVRAGTGTVTVVPNYQVILEGNLSWFSRFIVLCSGLYWMSDGVWDQTVPPFATTTTSFTVPNVGSAASFSATFAAPPPPDNTIISVGGAGDYVLLSVVSGLVTVMNTGYIGNAAPGTVFASPLNVAVAFGFWDDDDGTWDSSATVADLDYMRASVRTWKSDYGFPVLVGTILPDMPGGGIWDAVPAEIWDGPNSGFWSDTTDDIVLWPLAAVWEDEAFYGIGTPAWDAYPGDVWDSNDVYVAPSGGWLDL